MNVMYKWKHAFLFPFQSFIIFSCFIAVARTSNTMLNESHDNALIAVFPFLGKVFQFLPINYGFNFFNFSTDTPYQIEVVSFYPYFAENFYHE